MTDLGILFSINENGEIILNVDELKAMVTEFIYFPKNEAVQKEFMQAVIEDLPEVILGNKPLKELVTDVYESKGYEYACRIVEDALQPLSSDDFDTLYKEMEIVAVEEKGTDLYSGMSLSDINLEDIYNNICLNGDESDGLLGGLLEMEGLLAGNQYSGLTLEVYKFVETGLYLGYLA